MISRHEVTDAGDIVGGYLAERIGLNVWGSRRTQLHRQIAAAMQRAGQRDPERYCALLDEDGAEFDRLVSHVTVGESYFFREPRQFEVLRSTILPERLAARSGAALHLWSAGCASGQEAYSLAITLDELTCRPQARITATDLSREALVKASAGVYGRWSLRSLTDDQREAYFERTPAGYRIDDRFRQGVAFRMLNLLNPDAPPPAGVDVIFCRNVLIYFSPDAVAGAARRLVESLTPGGWLVTGPSDPPLHGVGDLVQVVTEAGVIYRRASHRASVPAVAPPASRRTLPPRRFPVVRPPEPDPVEAAEQTPDAAAAEILRLSNAGQLEAARDLAADAAARFPLAAELRCLQAVISLEDDALEHAVASARAALYLDPGLVMAHLVVARAELALGHTDRARRDLRNAARCLHDVAEDVIVPLSEGERAGRLMAMITAHLRTLDDSR